MPHDDHTSGPDTNTNAAPKRRVGDHKHRNGFDPAMLDVAVNAVEDAEEDTDTPHPLGVSTPAVAAQFPDDARFSDPRECGFLLRAAKWRGRVRRNLDSTGGPNGQPVERWQTRGQQVFFDGGHGPESATSTSSAVEPSVTPRRDGLDPRLDDRERRVVAALLDAHGHGAAVTAREVRDELRATGLSANRSLIDATASLARSDHLHRANTPEATKLRLERDSAVAGDTGHYVLSAADDPESDDAGVE